MKRKALSLITLSFLALLLAGCSKTTTTSKNTTTINNTTSLPKTTTTQGITTTEIKRVNDLRDLSVEEYTYLNIASLDKSGRVVISADENNGNSVGFFYHTWHGVHETKGEVLDITKLLNENPDYLGPDYLEDNAKKFHYWGEPLYGYYCSSDPWVITRHIELMMAMGIDYLAYDYTNAVSYDYEANQIFEILKKFKDQGFDVPKVTFYTNTGSANMICKLYNNIYSKGLYEDLWYAPNGKPLIIGVKADQVASGNRALFEDISVNFFDFRESQWPDSKTTIKDTETGFPWMNWTYPQENYNGMMSVSLAQHPGAKMSDCEMTNYGRGWDWNAWRNRTKNMEIGTNYQGEWNTVITNNSDSSKQKVTQVLITGFNEWMAQKLSDGNNSFFVDTFSEEYSRDVEMMKGGYDDNYVIQTLLNVRDYKFTSPVHYKYNMSTIDITDFENAPWKNFTSIYKDLVGDAIARDYRDAFSTTTYVDNSNRNDISKVYVSHDSNKLYVAVECADDITEYNGTDVNWMNLFISTEMSNDKSFGGFNYCINRNPGSNTTTLEKSNGGYNWTKVSDIKYALNGNTITFEIELSDLGLTADNCYLWIKATDNVTNYDDIMDYYVSGDSAPIGRFAYSYGY